MERQDKTIRVRLAEGRFVEATVVRWLEPSERALVSIGEDRWPLLVAREGEGDVYYPSVWPEPGRRVRPAWALIAVILASAAGLWWAGQRISGRPQVARPSPTPRRVVVRPAVAPVRTAPAVRPTPKPPPPVPAARSGPAHPRAVPAVRPAPRPRPRPAVRQVASAKPVPAPPRVRPAPQGHGAAAGRYLAAPPRRAGETPRVVAAGPRPVQVYRCECGRVFASEGELAAHRRRAVYSCLRYPTCRATASTPETIRAHYEAQLEAHGPCYSEAIRFGNRYKLVVRPECDALAADPARRRVVSVPARVRWDRERGRGWYASPIRASSRTGRPRYRVVWYWNPRTRQVFPVRLPVTTLSRTYARAAVRVDGYGSVLARR